MRGEATVLPAFDSATAFGVDFMDFDTHVWVGRCYECSETIADGCFREQVVVWNGFELLDRDF